MLQHVDIARSFLIEARVDRHSAEVLTDHGEYARAIAHAQQTVEKLLKAVLAVRHVIITDRHEVAEDFAQTFADWPRAPHLAQIGRTLERLGTRTEYPLFGDPNRPPWIPSEHYDESAAQQALAQATDVFDTVSRYLAEEHGMALNPPSEATV